MGGTFGSGQPPIKRLVFGKGLMSPTFDGEKRFTIRKYRAGSHDFTKGEIVIGEFMDGINVLLQITEDTKKASFKDLKSPKGKLAETGYWFDSKYFYDMQESFYHDMKWEDTGAVVFFEVLKVHGVPVVKWNDHAKTQKENPA